MLVASSASLCLLAACATTALGATYQVNATADDSGSGTCSPAPATCTSLRQAINTINNAPSPPDVINVAAGDYVLSNGSLGITENMTINGAGAGSGAGATTIDGNGDQVFFVSGSDPSSVTLEGMNVQGDTGDAGAAIEFEPSTATLTLNHDAIINNQTDDVGTAGIDFHEGGASGAALDITDSTIAGNTITASRPTSTARPRRSPTALSRATPRPQAAACISTPAPRRSPTTRSRTTLSRHPAGAAPGSRALAGSPRTTRSSRTTRGPRRA